MASRRKQFRNFYMDPPVPPRYSFDPLSARMVEQLGQVGMLAGSVAVLLFLVRQTAC